MAELVTKNTDTHDTPASGYVKLYSKTDKKLYYKDENGNEKEIAVSDGTLSQDEVAAICMSLCA